jgi:16S rRNA (adenine1518-N6/adenine1519-N6)-dimethyltransferase
MHPKKLLDQYQIRPKKSLGQNFLHDPTILARIVALADLSRDDDVLEIGPGLGQLTRLLAESSHEVIAVELDNRLMPILREELAAYQNVRLIHGDVLAHPPESLFQGAFKVVANLPYYVTGAILRHLLDARNRPSIMVLTLQKEVAQRITASPPKMSLLAVIVQYYGRARIAETIKAGAFWPKPGVDSAVIRIDVDETQVSDKDWLFKVVKAGFSQRRKQLKSSLRALGLSAEEITSALEQTQLDGRRRAQTLELMDWTRLASALSHSRRQDE